MHMVHTYIGPIVYICSRVRLWSEQFISKVHKTGDKLWYINQCCGRVRPPFSVSLSTPEEWCRAPIMSERHGLHEGVSATGSTV